MMDDDHHQLEQQPTTNNLASQLHHTPIASCSPLKRSHHAITNSYKSNMMLVAVEICILSCISWG
jgi:hypothetical protein